MRNIIISILTLFTAACASYDFVPTPAPKEILTLVYTTQSASGSKTWRLTNDDLKVKITSRSSSGQIISSKTIKSTAYNFKWVIYHLEQANFSESKSISVNSLAQTSETLIIETHAKTYTYSQNSSKRFPEGIQMVTSAIPGSF